MELFYKKLGEESYGEPLIIVHGLFGSSDNWYTLGKKFAQDYTVFLVDQRNHGHSPHSDEHNYELMADDLLEVIRKEHLISVNLLGHSMGGKTVMKFAEQYEEMVDKLIVADIGPQAYSSHHDLIIEALLSLHPETLRSRKEAATVLSQKIDNASIRQFLLKNLYWKEPGKLAWRMNVEVLASSIDNILEAVPSHPIQCETLFIRGDESGYIRETDFKIIHEMFPNSKIETIQGVGHWLHAEAPEEFYNLVINFIES